MTKTSPRSDPALVENSLQEILNSQYFRSSAQCSSLLRYIVQNTLADRDECLRERVIGSEVFARSPDYDTGNDHVVRSRASEVRKRLAQFYQGVGATAVHISIPSGSYRANFDIAESLPASASEAKSTIVLLESVVDKAASKVHLSPHSEVPQAFADNLLRPSHFLGRGPRLVSSNQTAVASALLLLIFAGLGLWARTWYSGNGGAYGKFWGPLNKSPKPALIYCGGGFVYKLSDEFLDDYRLKHGLKETRREFFVNLQHGESVPGPALISDNHFVPFGDLASTARIVTALSDFKKPYDIRYGEDLAFTEFRTSPVILIGGLNNSWALKVTHNLRYVLDQDDRIVDQWHRERIWTHTSDPQSQAKDDYAIVSRLNTSENGTGGFILSIAGIRMYGTRAAAELITDPERLNEVLKVLPRKWENKNLQLVLHTKIMNEIPISMNVEQIYSW